MRTLAADLSVSIITTRRAYEELERDGYIKTLPGRGSIVKMCIRDSYKIEVSTLCREVVPAR